MAGTFKLSTFTNDARDVMKRAQDLASKLGNQYVEIEHVMVSMLEQEGEGAKVLKNLGVDIKVLGRRLVDEIELLPKSYRRGRQGQVFVAKPLLQALEEAVREAKSFGDQYTTQGHLLAAVASQTRGYAARQLREAGATAEKIRETYKKERGNQKVNTPEGASASMLEQFAVDLTQMAGEGRLEPLIGRDEELRRIMQVLTRRTKNNPVLVGDPGTGKTAIVEGLAQRIYDGDVPLGLQGKRIMSLDVGSLVAGTSLRGQFEQRIKTVVKEIVDSEGQIILFLDEIHQIVGAGGGDGPMNASNMIKPALARGEMSLIGTTTRDEYREYIEADAGLERRMQQISIEEVSVQECVRILRGIKQQFEIHHNVQITDQALVTAAKMTDRYITDRALPDKAIDAVDEACSRLRLEIDSKPDELDELERQITNLEVERRALKDVTHADSVEDRERVDAQLEELREQHKKLMEHWELEKRVLDEVTELKRELEAAEGEMHEAERKGELGRAAEIKYSVIPKIRERVEAAQQGSGEVHPGRRMLKDYVDQNDVGSVIASWTGIPVNKMLESEKEKLLKLPDRLEERVVGQDHAIEALSKKILRARAGLQEAGKPIGSFFFVGPTGVGKTELAKALSEQLFDSEEAIVRIDMSEYMEASKVNTLIGSARGYVGSEQGGVLTEAVRQKPYSIVLFDEAEKAHPDVYNLLLQMLDEGTLTDSQGRRVDFSNTIIILTSNVGSREVMGLSERLERGEIDEEQMSEGIKQILKDSRFRPEFLNRFDEIIPFKALNREAIALIVGIQERRIRRMLAEQKLGVQFTDAAREFLAQEGYEPEYGARPLKRAFSQEMLEPLSYEIIEGKFEKGDTILVDAADSGDRLVFRKAGEAEEKAAE